MEALYFKMEETSLTQHILLTKITVHINNEGLHINILFNYLETMQMIRLPE